MSFVEFHSLFSKNDEESFYMRSSWHFSSFHCLFKIPIHISSLFFFLYRPSFFSSVSLPSISHSLISHSLKSPPPLIRTTTNRLSEDISSQNQSENRYHFPHANTITSQPRQTPWHNIPTTTPRYLFYSACEHFADCNPHVINHWWKVRGLRR